MLDNSNSHIEAGGAIHDIDGDGDTDILHGGSWNTNEIWWWENPYPDYDPEKAWARHTIKDYGARQHHDQVFGDFDGNRKTDLVFWNQQAGKLFIATIPDHPKDKNAWKFREIWTWGDNLKYEGLDKGDIDLDGKDDIEWGNGNNPGSKTWILYGNGKGDFTRELLNAATDIGNHESKTGDVNGDGRPDIVQKPFQKSVPRLDIWLLSHA